MLRHKPSTPLVHSALTQVLFSLVLILNSFALFAQNAAFEILDIGERSYQNGPALAIVLSQQLDGKRHYDKYIEVQNRHNGTINGSWQLSDNRRILYFTSIEPETEYTVFVNPGLPAANGVRLKQAKTKKLTTRRITPGASFASNGLILPRKLARGLPVRSVNVAQIDLDFWRIDADKTTQYLNNQAQRGQLGRYSLRRLKNYGHRVFSGRYQLNLQRNHRTTTLIPVQDIEALRKPGVYVAIIKPTDDYPYEFATSTFFVSDLALISRQYSDTINVFVYSISSNKALSEVTVSLMDNQGKLLDEASSDQNGMLTLGNIDKASILIAQYGKGNNDDVSVLPLRGAALDLSSFRIDGPRHKSIELFTWGPRDLYRPGESVDVSVLLRDNDGHKLNNRHLFARLKRPDGRLLANQPWRGDEQGYFHHMLELERDAPTGTWTLQLRTDPAQKTALAEYHFQVEEFLPERMRLQLDADKNTLTGTAPFKIEVEGAYLYGAPASGHRLDSELIIRPAHKPFTEHSELKDFWFGDIDDHKSTERRQLETVKLDTEGRTTLKIHTLKQRARSPLRVGLLAHLFEPGGRKITRTTSTILWPGSALIGIKPLKQGKRFEPDGNARFEVIRVDTHGTRLPATNLQIKVIREERDYYWEFNNNDGWHHRYSESQYPVLQTVMDLSADQAGHISLPVEWGAYRLEILDPATRLTTRYRFHAGWSWSGNDAPTVNKPDAVNLGWDKAGYSAGETATLTLNSPHAGEALVLIESDELLWHQQLSVKAGQTEVQIPISDDWKWHDIYATAIVLRKTPRKTALNAGSITPKRAMGVLHLPLNREPRRLQVHIEAPEETRPDQRQTIRLRVDSRRKDFLPQQVKLTLAAVDLGVLNITRFETPDPWTHYFSRRRLGVDSRDSYNRIIELMDGKPGKLRFGGDMALKGSKRPDSKVQIVSLYHGLVSLDANGETQVELDLPSFNGRLRLMAVAWDDSSFGHAQREMTVAAPIVAEAGLPRFLAPGDQSTFTLDLFNRSDSGQAIEIKLSLGGPLLIKPLLTSNSKQSVKNSYSIKLAKGQRQTLTIPLLANGNFGVGSIDLQLDSGDHRIKRHWELPVQPAWPDHHSRQRWRLLPGQAMNISQRELNGLVPETVNAQLSASARPPLNPAAALKSLLQYPYGCVEQTTSRAWPLLKAEADLIKPMGIKPISNKDRNKRIRSAIKRVQGMQVSSGGFGLWNSDSPEEPWLTPYVADFLVSASEQGHVVPRTMMTPLIRRLGGMLRSGGGLLHGYSEAPEHLRLASRAYAGYVLSRINKAPLSALRGLYDNKREYAKSPLPLVHLGIALLNQGDQRRGKAALKQALGKPRDTGYLGDYGSPVRDTAQLITLLERNQQGSSGDLLFELANAMQDRSYLSTQDQAALFQLALELGDSKQPWAANLQTGDSNQALKRNTDWRNAMDTTAIEAGITLANSGKQPLYVAFEINGAPQNAPIEVTEPVRIQRHWYDRDGNPLDPSEPLKVGDLIIVELEVHSSIRLRHGLIVDRLPAGLELENLNLLDGDALSGLKINGLPLSDPRFKTTLQHQEYRDDRYVAALWLPRNQTRRLVYLARAVTPGSYTIPPPRLEDMYRPEIRATGKGGHKLEIKP